MAQNEQKTEEHSTLEQQSHGLDCFVRALKPLLQSMDTTPARRRGTDRLVDRRNARSEPSHNCPYVHQMSLHALASVMSTANTALACACL